MKPSPRHVWDQWEWVWHSSTYLLVALNVFLLLNDESVRPPARTTLLLLLALFAIWYTVTPAMGSANFWARHLPFAFLYFMVGWGIWSGLVLTHPSTMMLAMVWYPMVFIRLPLRWGLAGAAITTVILLGGAFPELAANEIPAALAVGALILLGASILGVFITMLIRQSENRQRVLDELRETQASLRKAERLAGILAERQRLAREIHDTLAQDFTSILMHLTAAQIALERSEDSVPRHVAQAVRTARSGLNEARRLVWALRPEALERLSLAESVQEFAAQWSAASGVPVSLTVTGIPQPLRPEAESTVLRAAQEALHNVQKHARASAVTLTLSYMSDLVALDVHDDGIGFDGWETASRAGDLEGGFGLRSLRERVESLSGRLAMESQLGQGTTLAISLPVTVGEPLLERAP